MNLEPADGRISRRTVTSALAWGVPVIALAVATPSAAASPQVVITPPSEGIVDASPGGEYAITFQITDQGVPVPDGSLTLTLDTTDVVALSPDTEGYFGPMLAVTPIEDGAATAYVDVTTYGTVTGTVTFGSTTVPFSFPVTLAG